MDSRTEGFASTIVMKVRYTTLGDASNVIINFLTNY